jgi:hypothetical protein
MTRLRDQLKVLILDLYLAWVEDPTLWIGVSMSPNSWKVGSRYNALHISKVIIPFVHRLADVGLIEFCPSQLLGPGAASNRTSRIRAAEPLIALFALLASSLRTSRWTEDRETVILRSDDGAGGPAKQIEYEDTARDGSRCATSWRTTTSASPDHFIDLPELDRPFVERVISTGVREGDVQRIPIGPRTPSSGASSRGEAGRRTGASTGAGGNRSTSDVG